MIYLYSGTPGSGKSLHIAKDMLRWLNMGKPVIANFDVNLKCCRRRDPRFHYVPNADLSPDFLISYAKEYWGDRFGTSAVKEGTIKVVIDEAQLIFNARDWNKPDRRAWNEFFTLHRKAGIDVFMMAQFDRMLDRQIRGILEYEVKHRKMNNFGLKGMLYALLFGGSLFCAVDMWYSMHEKVGVTFFRPKRKLRRFYDTYRLFSVEDGSDPLPDDVVEASAPDPIEDLSEGSAEIPDLSLDAAESGNCIKSCSADDLKLAPTRVSDQDFMHKIRLFLHIILPMGRT